MAVQLLLLVFPQITHAARVIWSSDPVLPGHAALLSVVGMTNSTAIQTRQGGATATWLDTPTLDGSTTSYGTTIMIPTSYAAEPFEIRAGGASDTQPFLANAARPWFLFSDSGTFSTPGGWTRVFGDAISLTSDAIGAAMLRLTPIKNGKDFVEDADAKALVLSSRASTDGDGMGAKPTRWHAFFDLPSAMETGLYKVEVSNSGGSGPAAAATRHWSPLCTFIDPTTPCLATLNVSTPVVWKTDVFTVTSQQPGPGRDATAAVQSAIAAAAKNGGGIVHFPRGQYFVTKPLIVAPGTVLRGEAVDLVAIYFAEANATTAPDAYVTSSTPGAWGVEKLTFFVTAYAKSIVRFQPGTQNAFMRGCRIRFDSYFCLEPQMGKGSRGRTTDWDHSVGTAVTLAGTNLFVTDNDIFSSGDVVSTLNNGAPGAQYMRESNILTATYKASSLSRLCANLNFL